MAQWDAPSPTLLSLLRYSFAVLSIDGRTRLNAFSKMKFGR
jgi:hypothetical protein